MPGMSVSASPLFPTGTQRAARSSVRPIRVALFSGNYDCVRDGANRALNRLVAHLLEREGAEVRVFSPRAPKPAFASAGDVRAVRSLALPGRPEYRLALGLTRATRMELEAFAPDIVHLSAPDLLGRQAQKWARAKRVPVVASLHTRFETYPAYYGMGFLRPMLERYLDRFYGDSDLILAPTLPIANELAAKHGAGRVSVWSRGIDPAAFHPSLRDEATRAAFGYAPGDVVPLFFGRLVQEKGLGVFADTIDALRASGRTARPLIVGEGPARGWLEKRVPGAEFAGHLEGAALGRAVASADILINPSVTEAFGNVNLEAMASGLAVVSADVPSASALIADGRTGWLVEAHKPMAYARAARMLMQEAPLRRAIAAAASREAVRYRWDDVLAGVASDYRRCLSCNGSKVDAAPRLLQELAA